MSDCQRGWKIQSETKGRTSVWVFVLLSTCCLPEETVADIKNGTWAFLKSKLIPSDRKESNPPTQSVRILCISQWHKLKISDVDNSVLSCSAVILPSRLLPYSLAIVSFSLPAGKCNILGCRAEGSQVRPEQGGGQDRTGVQGAKACPCMGRHLTGMAEASSVVLSLCMASYQ